MRNSSKLSLPIDITDKCFKEIVEKAYEVFKSQLMDKESRVKLKGKFIFIDFSQWIDYKAEMFWHLISLDKNERFGVFPCENNMSDNICKMNCKDGLINVTLKNGQVRNICLYRACRIAWITEIINLANKKDESIMIWEKDNKKHIRFKHQDVDYVIILDINRGKCQLISAFPVFYINKKLTFNNDYEEYVRKIKNQ